MSRVAAAGAVSRASIACTSPSPVRISTNTPPPSPAENGCVTASANAVAIAASTALPPRSNIARPARAASDSDATTMPRVPNAGEGAAAWADAASASRARTSAGVRVRWQSMAASYHARDRDEASARRLG